MENNDLDLDIFDDAEAYEWPKGLQIVRRGRDEYILINGRILTYYGAPVGGSEDARFYTDENIVRQLMGERNMCLQAVELHFAGHLWPLQAGVFDADTAVDLYRMLKGK